MSQAPFSKLASAGRAVTRAASGYSHNRRHGLIRIAAAEAIRAPHQAARRAAPARGPDKSPAKQTSHDNKKTQWQCQNLGNNDQNKKQKQTVNQP